MAEEENTTKHGRNIQKLQGLEQNGKKWMWRHRWNLKKEGEKWVNTSNIGDKEQKTNQNKVGEEWMTKKGYEARKMSVNGYRRKVNGSLYLVM